MSLVPFDDRDGWIWFDGRMVPWREAGLHVLSHGLHYASAVFEGERAYGGNIFRLRAHTERLLASGRLLGFEIPWSAEAIDAACREVLSRNGLSDGYLRPIAWRGSERLAIAARDTRIHLAIAAWAWPNLFGEDRLRGIRLGMARWRRPAPDTAPTASKASGLYMIGTLAKHAAEEEGFDDALMLDFKGDVAEATGANIFFIRDGEVHTPQADRFLNGITRQTIIQMLRDNGTTVHERRIRPEELEDFQECFLTGTAAEVTPVGQIGDWHFQVGQTTRKVAEDYERLVRA